MLMRPLLFVSLFLLGACRTNDQPSTRTDERAVALEQARHDYQTDPTSETNIIWLGRRQAYLGNYEAAIETYTLGLTIHPESFRLLRHRGHRYITLGRFDLAERDLARASELIAGVPDEVEPDGRPNPSGIPRSTNHSNVEYHLGLALYLQGRYEEAAEAYARCLEYSRVNDDMLCATTHWMYMTLRRLGRETEAELLLEDIDQHMEILENEDYFQLLRMYRQWTHPEEVLAGAKPDSMAYASRGYGVANWYRVEGRPEESRAILEQVVASGANPAAFGMIAAEVDLGL